MKKATAKKKTPEPIGPPGLVMAVMAFFQLDPADAQAALQDVVGEATRAARRAATLAADGCDNAAGDVWMHIHKHYRDRLTEMSKARLDTMTAADPKLEDIADDIAFESSEMGLLAGIVAGWHLRDQLLVTNGGAK